MISILKIFLSVYKFINSILVSISSIFGETVTLPSLDEFESTIYKTKNDVYEEASSMLAK